MNWELLFKTIGAVSGVGMLLLYAYLRGRADAEFDAKFKQHQERGEDATAASAGIEERGGPRLVEMPKERIETE